jgi:histidyl-tRNA synthetase
MSKKLSPISGFPEFLPEEQRVMQWAMDTIRSVYESFGFIPIETPAIERIEHIMEKGVQGKEVYVLRRFHEEEAASAEFALHFDLTVPLARYVAQHYGRLTFPFKRYQMQPVWRGERPQAGRYRQFYQSDIDVIGDGELSIYFDAEIPAVIDAIFTRLNIGPFIIRMNHRKVLQGLLQSVGLVDQPVMHQAIKVIDEMEKLPLEKTREAFKVLDLSDKAIDKLLEFFSIKKSPDETLKLLSSYSISTQFEAGVQELREVITFLKLLKVPQEHYSIDLKIARGLDYYTGVVYETILTTHPQLGSICSGGRYEDLAGVFINKKLPGVGISIGLTRLIPQLIKEGILTSKSTSLAPVLVTVQNPKYLANYLDMASRLRSKGIGTEVYLENKKLAAQFKYADKKGFRYLLIADDPEFADNQVRCKNMQSGEQQMVSLDTLEDTILSILNEKF